MDRTLSAPSRSWMRLRSMGFICSRWKRIAGWIAEEMAILESPETYDLSPSRAWERLKTRSGDRKLLGNLRALAEWREMEAQRRDVPRGHERVLVVDDEEAIVRVMYTSLSNLGYSVTACTGSKDALEKFRLSPDGFDLVISDQAMPGMTGNQLAQEIRGIRDDLPIIICSGNNTAPSTEEGERAGVAMFLHKPVERRELAEAIRSLLD